MEILDAYQDSFLVLIKIGAVIFLLIYLIFSYLVSKQVKIMTETLEVGFENPIRIFAALHLLMSVFVLILSIIIL